MAKTNKEIVKFVASNKVLVMADGRTNFATCTPEFLAHAELINKGTGELSDNKARLTDELASAENRLNLYLKGASINSKTVSEYQAKIDQLKEDKKQADKKVRDYMPKMTPADENLYNAYFWYQTTPEKESYDGEFLALYKRAFMEWFDSFGMKMGKKDFGFFATKLGIKKAGNKTYRDSKATTMTTAYGKRQFVELLYLIIIELMVKKGIIKNYEFTYVSPVQGDESVEKAEPVEEPTPVDYSTMKVADLRKIAQEKGIKGVSKMKKADLINALN